LFRVVNLGVVVHPSPSSLVRRVRLGRVGRSVAAQFTQARGCGDIVAVREVAAVDD